MRIDFCNKVVVESERKREARSAIRNLNSFRQCFINGNLFEISCL